MVQSPVRHVDFNYTNLSSDITNNDLIKVLRRLGQ